jgi:hypothetical protein
LNRHASSPASINTVAPLVGADESAASCLSTYVDMLSCIADVATVTQNCFVYLHDSTGKLAAITTVTTGQYIEVRGQPGRPLKL